MVKNLKKCILLIMVLLSFSFIIACDQSDKPSGKTPVSIEIISTPTKTIYTLNETFSSEGGKFKINYDDGTTEELLMTDEMCAEAITTSYGEKSMTFKVNVGDKELTSDFTYWVVYSERVGAYLINLNTLPALNEITVDDADKIITALEEYETFSQEEKSNISDFFNLHQTKLSRLESQIIDEFINITMNKVNKDFDFLNKGNYTEENLVILNGLRVNLIENQGNFTTLIDISQAVTEYYDNISNVETRSDAPGYTAEDHKTNTIDAIMKAVSVEMYNIETDKIDNTSITIETVNFALVGETKSKYDDIVARINEASDIEEINRIYAENIEALYSAFIIDFQSAAYENIYSMLETMKGTISVQLDRWSGETISITGQYQDVSLEYFADDGRWWIPAPYKIHNIVNSMGIKLRAADSASVLNNYYQQYYFEALSAVMMKNYDSFYAIEKNLNNVYDTDDSMMWSVLYGYWGSSESQKFTYNGILDEYRGEVYGNSDNNCYRLCPMFYKPGEMATTVSELFDKYNWGLVNRLIPIPKAVQSVEISKQPDKLAYEIGDNFTVSGGKIKITYNDTTIEYIDMLDTMYSAEDLNMVTPGDKSLTLRFEVLGENREVVINYTVVESGEVGTFVSNVNALPVNITYADKTTVLNLIDTFEAFNEEIKGYIEENYPAAKDKLYKALTVLITIYADDEMAKANVYMDLLNVYDYSEENLAAINTLILDARTALTSTADLNSAQTIIDNMYTAIAAIEKLSATNTLEEHKANTINSVDNVVTVDIYRVVNNGPRASAITVERFNLKEHADVSAAYNRMIAAINEASTKEAVELAFANGKTELYNLVLTAYTKVAVDNVKNLVTDMRNTLSSIYDTYTGNVNIDYMAQDDGRWYVPEQFKIKNIYEKVTVSAGTSKNTVFANYEKAYIEMLRAVLYRNLEAMNEINIENGTLSGDGYRWSAVWTHWGVGGDRNKMYEYDGCIEEYQGTIIGQGADFRLWKWGYNLADKMTTVDGLMEKYIYDICDIIPEI